jgi:hypothetical protein
MTSRLDNMHIKRLSRELSIKRKEALAKSLISRSNSIKNDEITDQNIPPSYFIKLPSMSKIKQKQSFSSLFNGDKSDDESIDSKPRSRSNSHNMSGKNMEQESTRIRNELSMFPKRRASINTQKQINLADINQTAIRRRSSCLNSILEQESNRLRNELSMVSKRRASDSTQTAIRRKSKCLNSLSPGMSLNEIVSEDIAPITPIRRQRNSISLFLQNSANRKNGSRRSSIKNASTVQYNDAYLKTITEASKKLLEFCQESGENDSDTSEDESTNTTNTATTNDDVGQNDQKMNSVSKPRNGSFVNGDGTFLPVIRDDSHLFRNLKDDKDDKAEGKKI